MLKIKRCSESDKSSFLDNVMWLDAQYIGGKLISYFKSYKWKSSVHFYTADESI